MKLSNGQTVSITFTVEVPKGTNPHVPGTPNVLVVEDAVAHWGIIRSIEMGAFRDGAIANDINTRNIGINERDGKFLLKFQLHDPTTSSVKNHAYRVEATINFFAYT